jgi:hypothetical protein
MTLQELLISLMSIFFIFNTATISINHVPFIILLVSYIISILEISIAPIFYKFFEKKIKGRGKE